MSQIKYIAALLLIFVVSCSEDTINNCIPSNNSGKPMWPMYGYNARHTGNINSLNTFMKPVNEGVLQWEYIFPNGAAGDGSEITVDSKGNVYFLNQSSLDLAKLYKFTPEGNIIWAFDTIHSNNYFGLSLSADETRLFFAAFRNENDKGLYCLDSSGRIIWRNDIGSFSTRPVINSDNVICCLTTNGLFSLDINGNIIWSNTGLNIWSGYGELALDRENNIYTCGAAVIKVNSRGEILWSYSPYNNFRTQGVVIDANNNIYFTPHFISHPYGLYSLTKEGRLRWQIDSAFTFTPAISYDNIIYCGGNGITAIDTSGRILWHTLTYGNDNHSAESPVLDDESNVYYIVDGDNRQAGSFDKSGNVRWVYAASWSTPTLPGPALSPLGSLIFSPKRSGRISVVK